jgi:hypothetical protein
VASGVAAGGAVRPAWAAGPGVLVARCKTLSSLPQAASSPAINNPAINNPKFLMDLFNRKLRKSPVSWNI